MDNLYNQKRVQAWKNASDAGSITDSASDTSALDAVGDSSSHDQDGSRSNGSEDENEYSEKAQSDKSDTPPEDQVTSISFGALAKAQETLGKRVQGRGDAEDDLRGSNRRSKVNVGHFDSEALERKAGKKDTRDFARASKHAPAELSSKKAVSRKREVVPSKKIDYRDPRFEPLSGPLDEEKLKKNYSFLDTYRDSEMNELQSAIRKTKNPEAKEKLKRALLSMQSRKKAQQMKEQEQEVLREHRKDEKAKIEQGKKPFYLKKADQKQLALKKRFEGMKKRQVDKVIERRRKKQAGKEKKAMPNMRRG